MHYKRGYEVTYTWHCYGDKNYYTESLDFESEKEANRFCLEQMHSKEIEVIECKKICYEKWEK